MAPRNRRNPLALAVLSCLYERPMHPYEVAQTLRHRVKHESIRLNYGSLYSVVEGLERSGLISARETVREGRRPERTVYEITDSGARELVEWLSDLVSTPVKEYLQFEAALSLLPVLAPEEAVDLLGERANALMVQIAMRRGARAGAEHQGLPRLFTIEDEYVEMLQEAELDWVERLVKEIEGGSLEGIEQWRAWHERLAAGNGSMAPSAEGSDDDDETTGGGTA
ncbi:MAG TPA: PadR family transcriptional regulator [Actinomycetota bacterium]|jgi:DNA-binding PadR family transcriptional regulator